MQEDFELRDARGRGTFTANLEHFDPRNPYAGDDTLNVQFYMGAEPDVEASEKEGREIMRDAEMIRILINKDEILVQEVNITHRRRWPRQYAAWKATGHNAPGMSGTKLEHLYGVTPAQIAELNYHQIHSIERLAEAPESALGRIPGMQALKQRAQAYLQVSKDNAPILAAAKIAEENEALKARTATLEETLAEMAKEIQAMKATQAVAAEVKKERSPIAR